MSVNLKCPYCQHVFPPQDKGQCPSCGKVVLIPMKARSDPRRAKERFLRLAHRRRERLAKIRKASGAYLSRRMRITTVFVAFFVLGVVLPLRYAGHDARIEKELSKEERTTVNLWVLRTALECFRRDCQRYPSPEEGLKSLVLQPSANGWNGPYIDALKPDPWGTPYRYTLVSNEVVLTSTGPDREHGTDDDIASPPPDTTVLQWPSLTNMPRRSTESPGEYPVNLTK